MNQQLAVDEGGARPITLASERITDSDGAMLDAAAERLRSICERVEKVREEKAMLAEAEKEIFAEAKGNGYDVAALREVLKRRSQDAEARAEREAMVSLYAGALDGQMRLL